MDVLRGLIRPLLTVEIISAYLWAFLHPVQFTPERLALLFAPVIVVLTFWFGERTLKRLGLDLSDVFKQRGKP